MSVARVYLACGLLLVAATAACRAPQQTAPPAAKETAAGGMDRTVLPIAEPQPPTITEIDARKATAPPRFEVKAPQGAPNVVIVLIDDIGFGSPGTFGGPINMPTLDKLSAAGLRYNRFHTTALCSPTRTALLTGRNHHINNAGAIMELATAFPGNTGIRPNSVTPLAEILRLNGYSTAAFGKYHETPPWEVSVSGPYDRWPTRSGFDKFYGFIGGETNQWAPAVFDGVTRVEVPHTPNYHFTTDMTDQAIGWAKFQHAMTPEKPFYMYFATGATHAPHHAPKEYIEKYRGKFDEGWDRLRERTLARQIEMGVVPAGTKLTPRPAEIPAWDPLTADQKRLFARQMEAFAGFAEHTDHEVGPSRRSRSRRSGQLDNTIFFYIVGDNGASAEGGPDGSYNEILALNGIVSDVSSQLSHIDDWGGPTTFPHFSIGWAHAMNTPFQWTKQVASHFGGTRNPMVLSWPARIKARTARSGRSFTTSSTSRRRRSKRRAFPSRPASMGPSSIRWTASRWSTRSRMPRRPTVARDSTSRCSPTGRSTTTAGSRRRDTRFRGSWCQSCRPLRRIAGSSTTWPKTSARPTISRRRIPQKLKDLQALFTKEAERNHVLPLDDRRAERFDARIAGRPDLLGPRTSLTLAEGMTGITENAFINVKGRSFTIAADIDVPRTLAEGVIISQAGRFGGWSLYMKGGKVNHVYNYGGLERYTVSAPQTLTPGTHTILYEFVYDGGQPGSGGMSRLSIDGKFIGEARVNKTMPFVYSADEGVDVGVDNETR